MISRRQTLIWSALMLATGYSAPAFAQPTTTDWLLVEANGRVVDRGVMEFCGGQYRYAHEVGFYNDAATALTITSSRGAIAQPGGFTEYWRFVSVVRACQTNTGCPGGWRHWIDCQPMEIGRDGMWDYAPGWRIAAADDYGDQQHPEWIASITPPNGEERFYTIRVPDEGLSGSLGWFDLAWLRSENTYAIVHQTATTLSGPSGAGTFSIWIGDPMRGGDYDADGEVAVPDLFAFLGEFFAGTARAGACDGVSGCTNEDVWTFLRAWVEG